MRKILISFFIIFFLSLLFIEPVFANLMPNDPYYGNQWYLAKIKADSAWSKISESPDIVIAVIDSGVGHMRTCMSKRSLYSIYMCSVRARAATHMGRCPACTYLARQQLRICRRPI